MELWGDLAEHMLRLLDQYDDLVIFLWLLIEETGFPLPLPGDLAMLLAGHRVAEGKLNAVWALVLLESATLIGGSVLYWLRGRRGGPPPPPPPPQIRDRALGTCSLARDVQLEHVLPQSPSGENQRSAGWN